MDAFVTPPATLAARDGDLPHLANSNYRGSWKRHGLLRDSFRRRNNIRNFVDGLEDSECWPYPQAQDGQSISPTFGNDDDPMLMEVGVRPSMVEELTVLTLANVHKGDMTLVDLTIELSPDDGVGAYMVDYEVVEDVEGRAHNIKLNMEKVADVRSAFMHRYEWVANKVKSVNSNRREAWVAALNGEWDTDAESGTNATVEPPSEEEDFDEESSSAEESGEEGAITEPDLVVMMKPVLNPSGKSSWQKLIDLRRAQQQRLEEASEPAPAQTLNGNINKTKDHAASQVKSSNTISKPPKRDASPSLESGAKRQRLLKKLLDEADNSVTRAASYGADWPDVEAEAGPYGLTFAVDWDSPERAFQELVSGMEAQGKVLRELVDRAG